MRRQGTHQRSLRPLREQLADLLVQALHPGRRLIHGSQVLLEANLLARMIEALLAQPTLVHAAPRAPAIEATPVTQQEALHTLTRLRLSVLRVFTTPSQIT